MVRNPLNYFDALAFQSRGLVRVVGQQPHLFDPELAQYRCRVGVVALVVREPQTEVGVDRVEPAILQRIGTELVGKADAPPLLT